MMAGRLTPALALVLLVALAATTSACERTGDRTAAATAASSPGRTTAPRQTIAPTHPAVATVPFDLSGSGDQDTSFQSATPWKITWSFDCANLGQTGSFALAVAGDNGTNHTTSGGAGMRGHGSVTNSDPNKTFNLRIRSACRWQISASS